MLLIVTVVLMTTVVILCFLKGGTRGGGRRRSRRVGTTTRAIAVLVVSGGEVGVGSTNLPSRMVRRTGGLVRHTGLPVMGTGIKPEIVALVTSRRVCSSVPIGGRIGTAIDNLCVANMHKLHKPLRGPIGGGGKFHTGLRRGCGRTGTRLGRSGSNSDDGGGWYIWEGGEGELVFPPPKEWTFSYFFFGRVVSFYY